MITRFHEIGLTGRKKFTCACGRKLTRQRRFYQTLNPYNRDSAGNVKSQRQIIVEVRTEVEAWMEKQDPCTHVPRKG